MAIIKHIVLLSLLLLACGCVQEPENIYNPVPATIPFTIRGFVYEATDSAQLAGVEVKFSGDTSIAYTDSSGSFAIPGRAASNILTFTKQHYQTISLNIASPANDTMLLLDTLFMERDYAAIAGSVFNSEDSTALAGATAILLHGTTPLDNFSTVSDGNGLYAFSFVNPDSANRIAVSKAGYAPDTAVVSSNAGDSIQVNFGLAQYQTVTGYAYDADLITPLSGVTITADRDTAVSDNSGAFTLSRLLPSEAGTVFFIWLDKYKPMTLRDTVARGKSAMDTVFLFKKAGSIQVTVDLQGQTAHAGVTVSADSGTYTASTNDSGIAILTKVPIGRYTVNISKTGFKTENVPVIVNSEQSLIIQKEMIIQTGTISRRVDWWGYPPGYHLVYDSLTVADQGSLFVHPGVLIQVMDSAWLGASGNGFMRMHGTTDSLVRIYADIGGIGQNYDFALPSASTDTVLRFAEISGGRTTVYGGNIIDHSIFVDMEDSFAGNKIEVKSGTGSAVFNQCSFVTYNAQRSTVSVQDAAGLAGASFSNCLFYQYNGANVCGQFLVSANPANSIKTRIANCSFFATCTMPQPLLSQINADSSQVYQFDPQLTNILRWDFHLLPGSPALDKSSSGSFLGAQGVLQ